MNKFWNITINFLKRDIKARYTESLLGWVWVIVYPLIMTLISTLVFALVFSRKVGEVPYFLFSMIGFIIWRFFYQSLSIVTRSLISNRGLVINMAFNRETIIVSSVLSRLVDFLVNLVVFGIILIICGYKIGASELFLILVLVLGQFLFVLGLGFFTSAINVYIRDVENLVDILNQILFYATPIIYPLSIVPILMQKWIWLNPVAGLIILFRRIVFESQLPWEITGCFLGLGVFVLVLGWLVFKKLERRFAELV